MSLIQGNTKWVLFLASSREPEERHISDLAFGLHCLESSGIQPSEISIYVDGRDRQIVSQFIRLGTQQNYNIKAADDFFADQAQNTHENLVMFVTGHGSINGIDATSPINPYKLLSAVKASPKLTQAVLYLGQCYAGIFNYVSAGRGVNPAGITEPNVIIIGATNLHESISSSTQEQLGSNSHAWVANLFLLHVFKWIASPVDVDGDGKYTVIDSYKYAGAMSNGSNKDIKIGSFVRSIDLHDKWVDAKHAHTINPTPQSDLALRAVAAQYENELAIRYTHQEGWILNAIPAQSLEF
jgi:hypothetical protein